MKSVAGRIILQFIWKINCCVHFHIFLFLFLNFSFSHWIEGAGSMVSESPLLFSLLEWIFSFIKDKAQWGFPLLFIKDLGTSVLKKKWSSEEKNCGGSFLGSRRRQRKIKNKKFWYRLKRTCPWHTSVLLQSQLLLTWAQVRSQPFTHLVLTMIGAWKPFGIGWILPNSLIAPVYVWSEPPFLS